MGLLIQKYGFPFVRIVTEPPWNHPCIDEIMCGNPQTIVSIRSHHVIDDACAFMTARNLAYGSPSTFIGAMELLNERSQRVFRPWPCTCEDGDNISRCFTIAGGEA